MTREPAAADRAPAAPTSDPAPCAAVQCDRMCAECTKTCTRDWGHSGPHRCDTHARG